MPVAQRQMALRVALAGTAIIAVYLAYKWWTQPYVVLTPPAKKFKPKPADEFAGWEKEVDRILGGKD